MDKKLILGEQISFIDIFRKCGLSIRIPIIQRDYAQGRESAKEVRKAFLGALRQYLGDDKPNGLDFVYGAEDETKDGGNFLPLDGQQRLTTLFLLHWYLAQITDNRKAKEEFYRYILDEQEYTRFSYETRPSARDFCEALLYNTKEQELDIDKYSSVSESIREQPWYFLSWDNDPTIVAMLTTIDDISEMFSSEYDGLEKLLDENNPRIVFHFLDLKGFGLTDDLYIKMNGRGKALTPFENLKANLEHYLRYKMQDKEFADRLARSMDTTWSDLLWHYRNADTQDNTADSEWSNLLQVLLGYAYLISTNYEGECIKKLLDEVHSFMGYEELGAISLSSLHFVEKSLNTLSNGDKPLEQLLVNGYDAYIDEDKMFRGVISSNKPSYNERLIFFGYLIYLYEHGKPSSSDAKALEFFCDWMRLVRNLYNSDNLIIDTVEDYCSAFKGLHRMAKRAKDPYHYISQEENKPQGVSQAQFAEERYKAQLIRDNREAWLNRLMNVETHEYFQGQVGFLIEFAKRQNGVISIEKFDRYSALACELFRGGYFHRRREDYLLERAVLVKGDYIKAIDSKDQRANMLSTAVGGNIYRDNSWRRRLRVDEERYKSEVVPTYFKALLDDHRLVVGQDVYVALARIIDEEKDRLKGENISFRKALIDHPKILEYATQGFIAVVDESENEGNYTYRVLTKQKLNSLQVELYSYALFLDMFDSKYYSPFMSLPTYVETNSSSEPYLLCGIWEYFGVSYEVWIDCYVNESAEAWWRLGLWRVDRKDHYNEKLTTRLKAEGYDIAGLPQIYGDSREEIIEEFYKLCHVLQELKPIK